MVHQNIQNKDMNLVLSSTDAKPRLKWTPELHQRFVDAVNQLGGSYKATPKSLMKVMAVDGLTLYHLKSHLQKYRLGKSQQSHTCNENNQLIGEAFQETENQINESSHIAQALHVQMEIQRKLYEQIEVQRHLQLRIEAQGKYLQSVLQKAQETLSKEQLSELVSKVDMGCISSLSVLTEIEGSILKDSPKKLSRRRHGSIESSLTSSEDSRNEIRNQTFDENVDNDDPEGERKGMISDANGVEQPSAKRFQSYKFDLNKECINDLDSDTNILELNCNGMEQLIG